MEFILDSLVDDFKFLEGEIKIAIELDLLLRSIRNRGKVVLALLLRTIGRGEDVKHRT